MLFVSELFGAFAGLIGPAAAVLLYAFRVKQGWKWILSGAACYVVTELIIRLPLLSLLNSDPDIGSFLISNPYLYAALMAGSAAVLGIGARWLITKILLGWNDTNTVAIGFGLGYGGIEAALVSGTYWFLAAFSGTPAASGLTWDIPFWAGVERISILLFQIIWTMMTVASVREKKPLLFWAALAFNFLVIFAATCAASIWNWPVWLMEILMLAGAVWLSWVMISNGLKEDRKRK
ncbi:MAG: YhfC family intramembrane metalloprotease [Erysipelotrichaceae bacterium]|nr:YhfC family intramembrane metalloprotease [Erysipelotrichaceae bacterium]